MNEYITKKQLLELTNISYGQLYRWKRLGLIPESWFIKRAAVTGQETVLPRKKSVARINKILQLMKSYSIEQLVEKLAFNKDQPVITFEELYQLPYLDTQQVNAIGNYFKSESYTATQLVMIISMANVSDVARLNTRQFVDLLRFALPVADKIQKIEVRCLVFAAGGDYHLAIIDNGQSPIFDDGLRLLGNYNFETIWEKLKDAVT